MDFNKPPDFENSNIETCDVTNGNPEVTVEPLQSFTIKPGIKLPRSRSNDICNEANNYFKSTFSNFELKADSVDEAMRNVRKKCQPSSGEENLPHFY